MRGFVRLRSREDVEVILNISEIESISAYRGNSWGSYGYAQAIVRTKSGQRFEVREASETIYDLMVRATAAEED